MGAAPSAEILREAPFCSVRSGPGRTIALIPLTEKLFWSPDSPLFMQLYEARNDPYVRYYMRRTEELSSEIRLDCIPPVTLSREEYYKWCRRRVWSYHCYPSNESLRHEYVNNPSKRHLVRPVPCAVAFQYDDPFSAPEGCAPLGDTFVKIIGGIGCLVGPIRSDSEEATTAGPTSMDLRIFLRKSAGDHNMVRVMLFSASLFYDHCIRVCGLPCVPMNPITFYSLMTNIPFLCFLRELRNRIDLFQGNTKEHIVWIDGAFVRGLITAKHASELCEVLAHHYGLMLESKPRTKQDALVSAGENRSVSVPEDGNASSGVDVEDTGLPAAGVCVGRTQKQFFTLGGFIDKDNAVVPASCRGVNEVYIACVDTLVRVVVKEDGGSHESGGEHMFSDVMQISVRRGDILRFEPDESDEQPQQRTSPLHADGIAKDTIAASAASASASGDAGEATSDAPIRHGTWHVDSSIHLENVLLSFVHNECKSAREASADDPHWLRNQQTGKHVFDESFYIWRFERKGATYYYGTVPKFAHTHKKLHEMPRRRGLVSASAGSSTPAARQGNAPRYNTAIQTIVRGGMRDSEAFHRGTTTADQNWVLFPMANANANEANSVPILMNYMNPSTFIPSHAAPMPLIQVHQHHHQYHQQQQQQQHYVDGRPPPPPMLVQPTTSFAPSFNGMSDVPRVEVVEQTTGGANYAVYPTVVSSPVPCVQSVPTSSMQPVHYVSYMQPLQSLQQPQEVPAMYVCLDPSTAHLTTQQQQQQQQQPMSFMPILPQIQQSAEPSVYTTTPLWPPKRI